MTTADEKSTLHVTQKRELVLALVFAAFVVFATFVVTTAFLLFCFVIADATIFFAAFAFSLFGAVFAVCSSAFFATALSAFFSGAMMIALMFFYLFSSSGIYGFFSGFVVVAGGHTESESSCDESG